MDSLLPNETNEINEMNEIDVFVCALRLAAFFFLNPVSFSPTGQFL